MLTERPRALTPEDWKRIRKSAWQRSLPAALIFFTGLALTSLLVLRLARLERSRIQEELRRQTRELVFAVQSAVENDLDTLHSLESFFAAAEPMDRKAFQTFSGHMLRNHPAILALTWLPRIPQAARSGLEAKIRLKDRPQFRIWEPDASGRPQAAPVRDEYFPALYVQPELAAPNFLGLNYHAVPDYRSAMEQARDSAASIATRILPLPDLTPPKKHTAYSMTVFRPIYRPETSLQTVEERRRELSGFVAAVFRVEALIDHALRNHTASGIQLQIFSESPQARLSLIDIYFAPSRTPEPGLRLSPPRWSHKQPLKHLETLFIAGRPWTFLGTSTPLFLAKHPRWESSFVLMLGFLLSFLAAGYAVLMEQKRLRDLHWALSVTDELTGLYNRRGFLFLAEEQMKTARRTQKGFFLILLDLDHLKKINNTFGHAEGDWAIAQTGAFLKSFFRASDVTARIGGDEFAVLMTQAARESRAKILHALRKNFVALNTRLERPYRLSLSAGAIYFEPESPLGLAELLDLADQELYDFKRDRPSDLVLNRLHPYLSASS